MQQRDLLAAASDAAELEQVIKLKPSEKNIKFLNDNLKNLIDKKSKTFEKKDKLYDLIEEIDTKLKHTKDKQELEDLIIMKKSLEEDLNKFTKENYLLDRQIKRINGEKKLWSIKQKYLKYKAKYLELKKISQ